jgi:hypothetical protein
MLPMTGPRRKEALPYLDTILEAQSFDEIEPKIIEADYSSLQPLLDKRELLQSEISELEKIQTDNDLYKKTLSDKIDELKKAPVQHVIGDISDDEFLQKTLELKSAELEFAAISDVSEALSFKRNAVLALNAKIEKLKSEIHETMFKSFNQMTQDELKEVHQAFYILQNQLNSSLAKFKGVGKFCHDNKMIKREIYSKGIGSIDLNMTALELDKYFNNMLHLLR